ncbi:MAG: hypothetical protein ABIR06_06550 [Cyclobacteriaceae bacterium]
MENHFDIHDFIFPASEIDGILVASMEEIALMTLDTISRGLGKSVIPHNDFIG